MGSNHKNSIVDHSIKKLTLGSRTLLFHATIMWPEDMSTKLLNLYFKAAFQRYNSLEMEKDKKTSEQKFSGVEFQIYPTDYHTWGYPVFVLEAPL